MCPVACHYSVEGLSTENVSIPLKGYRTLTKEATLSESRKFINFRVDPFSESTIAALG